MVATIVQVRAQPMKEEFPVTHPSQLAGNPALGLPLQLGHCDSCGATDLAKCQGDSLLTCSLCFTCFFEKEGLPGLCI